MVGLLLVYPAVDDGVGGGYGVWVAVAVALDVLATTLVALVRKRDSAPINGTCFRLTMCL